MPAADFPSGERKKVTKDKSLAFWQNTEEL
jgi:hypothetical protein